VTLRHFEVRLVGYIVNFASFTSTIRLINRYFLIFPAVKTPKTRLNRLSGGGGRRALPGLAGGRRARGPRPAGRSMGA
jgi:hypothetical protein